jgi:hypothetical protein
MTELKICCMKLVTLTRREVEYPMSENHSLRWKENSVCGQYYKMPISFITRLFFLAKFFYFINLFIYGLFNDAISNWKYGKKRSWLNLRYQHTPFKSPNKNSKQPTIIFTPLTLSINSQWHIICKNWKGSYVIHLMMAWYGWNMLYYNRIYYH